MQGKEKRPSQYMGVVAIEKKDFGSVYTEVTNFSLLDIYYMVVYVTLGFMR